MTVRNSVAKAAQIEVKALPEPLRTSTLAAAALDLAARLDLDPSDRDATGLVRELRMVLAELRRLSTGDLGGELDAFLRDVSAPSFRQPGD